MTKIPGTYHGKRFQEQCPYASEHRLPNGGRISRAVVAGRGTINDMDVTEGLQTTVLRCMLGHEWTPRFRSPSNQRRRAIAAPHAANS